MPLHSEALNSLSAFKILSSFTVYYLAERILRYVISKHFLTPDFQAALRASRKDSVYWGILLGAFISFTSFPFCANAVRETWLTDSGLNVFPSDKSSPPTLSFSAEVCITSRAVLWISELNRLDLYAAYVYHHMGSITMLLSAFYLGVTHLMYVPFATLVSEIPGDFVWILSAHRDMETQPPIEKYSTCDHPRVIPSKSLEKTRQWLQSVNLWIYVLARVPSIPVMMYCSVVTARKGLDHYGKEWASVLIVWTILILSLYSWWIGAYVKRQVVALEGRNDKVRQGGKRTLLASFSLQHPIHIHFQNGLILTLYGPLMGLALASLCLITFFLSPVSASLRLLSLSLILIILFAILFARILSLIFEDTISAFLQNPVRVFFRPGFWLYGGFLGSAIGLLIARLLGLVSDLTTVATSICIALPLYEGISRLGCHTYGCCYGQPVGDPAEESCVVSVLLKVFRPVVYTSASAAAVRLDSGLQNIPLLPIQLISSALFFTQFAVVWILGVHLRILDIQQVAGLSLALHALTRLWTESLRRDFRGGNISVKVSGLRFTMSVTARVALGQLILGVLLLIYPSLHYANRRQDDTVQTFWDQLGPVMIMEHPWVRVCLAIVFSIATIVYGMHKDEIGRGLAA